MKFVTILVLTISFFSYLLADTKTYKVKTDSKGVKTFYNKNKPADPNFKIELKKICEITYDYLDSLGAGKFKIFDFDFNKEGDILILDYNRMWKFNRNGRYISKWSRKGYGPGEIVTPFFFHLANDIIYVNNKVPKKIIKFDNNGKFINDIFIKNLQVYPKNIFYADDNILLGCVDRFNPEKKRNIDKIIMYDSKTFKVKKTLFEREYKKTGRDIFGRKNYFIYAGDEKVFFVVDNSLNDYKINCYDSRTGKMKYKIRKNHLKVKNDEEVKNHYGTLDGEKVKMQTGNSIFKESINQIFYDKYDRLWVNSNNREPKEEGCMYFDIFKDGIFLNRIKLELNYSYIHRFRFNGNKIVEYITGDNVYIYEFK